MADNLTTFMWRLSRNLGLSVSWNRHSLSRTVQELLYRYPKYRVGRETLVGTANYCNLNDPGFGAR